MIRYEEIEAHLIDFLQGNVAEEVEYRIRAYLQQHPDFQQELDELSETLEFTQNMPLAQPAPELKMNFYAMLNDYKAQQARPSIRTRLKTFLSFQVQWQMLSVGVFSILLLIVGYGSISIFQQKYKGTEVAMQKIEFEKEQIDKAPLVIPSPKRKEKSTQKQTENIAQAKEEHELLESNTTEIKTITNPTLTEYAKDEAPNIASPVQEFSLYNFNADTENGTLEINNPLGNINLRSYTGVEVKVESVPIQGFKGETTNNKIVINGLAYAPQMDMQVYLPQNREVSLQISAKQNIIADLSSINVASDSYLTSFTGDVEIYVPKTANLEINASAREIENDFEAIKNLNDAANYQREETKLPETINLNSPERKAKNTKSRDKISKKDASNQARGNSEAKILEDENTKISTEIASPNKPQLKTAKIILQKGRKNIQINSLQGKAKIKKVD